MDLVKVTGVEEWKEPKTVKDIHKFLGFCNFYRRFIQGFSHIAKPLNSLLKKDVKWSFGNAEKAAFEKLKKLICEEPVLIHVKALRALRHATCTQCSFCGFKVRVRSSLRFDETVRSKGTEV
jgi:hypothetical protein